MSVNVSFVSDRRGSISPAVTFLVPVYNERNTLLSVLDALARFPEPHEIIVIDDGSTDGTRELLREERRANALILFHEGNAGKGAAIRTGLGRARGAHVAIQDADLEYDPAQYAVLLGRARGENLPAVFGSRFLMPNPSLYRRFRWGNKAMTAWINLLGGARLTDSYTCYKLIERKLFMDLSLSSRGFEMEAEICMKLAQRGVRIVEVPIRYNPRRVEEGKKIGWKDAVQGAWTALKLRLFATAHHPHPALRATFPQEGKDNKGFPSPLGRGQGEGPR